MQVWYIIYSLFGRIVLFVTPLSQVLMSHQVLLTTGTDLSVMLKVGLVSEEARLTSDQ